MGILGEIIILGKKCITRQVLRMIKAFYDKVIDICEKKLAINPDDAEAYYHFGLAYGYKGNYDKTIEYSQKELRALDK